MAKKKKDPAADEPAIDKPVVSKENPAKRFGNKINTNGFAQNPSNAGRKPNLVKSFLKEFFGREASKKDLDGALASLAGLTREELEMIVSRGDEYDGDTSVIVFMAAQQYKAAMMNPESKEAQSFLIKILEFLRGKPTEKIEVTVSQEIVVEMSDLEGLTQSEINAFFKATAQIEKAHKKRREALGEGQTDN